jgi:hypothetical protein
MPNTTEKQSVGSGVDQQRLISYSPNEVRDAMIAADITEVPHHDCGGCGVWVKYLRHGEQLYFGPGCGCSWSNPEPRSWADAADWLNMQSRPDIQQKLAARFGLANDKTARSPAAACSVLFIGGPLDGQWRTR